MGIYIKKIRMPPPLRFLSFGNAKEATPAIAIVDNSLNKKEAPFFRRGISFSMLTIYQSRGKNKTPYRVYNLYFAYSVAKFDTLT